MTSKRTASSGPRTWSTLRPRQVQALNREVHVRLYVVQMFYSSLKESGHLVAEAKNTVSTLSKNDFVLMGFGEHTSAIAFVSNEPEANMTAQFGRIRGEKFSLVAFEVAWFLGGNMSKPVSDWLERHKPSPFKGG
jgi:hypothetical protein